MKKLLPTTLSIYSNGTKRTVADLIGRMKADKSDISNLLSSLRQLSNNASYNYPTISPLNTLSSEVFVDAFRDATIRMSRHFNAANATQRMLSSMVDILFAEIEKNENELDQLESFIDNYEFIAGKDDSFNSNYIEKFNNNLNDYTNDNPELIFYDRDGSKLTDSDIGFIDSANGYLRFGNSIQSIDVSRRIDTFKYKIVSNCQNYITTQTDSFNLFNDVKQDAWTVTVKSPTILDSSLSDYSNYLYNEALAARGAKFVLEIPFKSATEINSIKISPNQSNGLQLLQVIVISSNSTNANNNQINSQTFEQRVMSKPLMINSTVHVCFEKKFVNKIILIFNQSNYVRTTSRPLSSEINSKLLDNILSENNKNKFSYFSKFQDVVYWFYNMKNTVKGIKTSQNSLEAYYSCNVPESIDTIVKDKYTIIDKNNSLEFEDIGFNTRISIISRLAYGMLSTIAGTDNIYDPSIFIDSTAINPNKVSTGSLAMPAVKNSNIISDKSNLFNESTIHVASKEDVLRDIETKEAVNLYEYSFSLRSIDFGLSKQNSNKAFFVSKKIINNNHPAAVKAKILPAKNLLNEEVSAYDIPSLFSYEISISNKQDPKNDIDWTPISNYGDSSISTEVVFFNANKKSRLRFWAKNNTVKLYKNGMLVQPINYSFSAATNELQIVNLDIDPNSIYVVEYDLDFIGKTPDIIDLANSNLFMNLVRPYSDKYGRGQTFSSTTTDNSIILDQIPFINKSYIPYATYSPSLGTIFSQTAANYSPVKVKLSNGTFAINLTNYTDLNYTINFSNFSGVAFRHVGNRLVFNVALNETFQVYYDYIPNNLRYKIVIRKNIPEINSDYAIDAVILKMKSLNYDPFFDKITKIKINN